MSFSTNTLHRYVVVLLAGLWLCTSCIDEFNADLPESDQVYLVVEGSICGQSECEFHLSRSLPLSPTSEDIIGRYITDAKFYVCGSDNSRAAATHVGSGLYKVNLGVLDITQKYWVEIEWEGRAYQSDATQPLTTPDIVDLHFEQPREDQQVDILITPSYAGEGEIRYFQWDYFEHWEIHTPYSTNWEYLPDSDKIVSAPKRLNIGWMQDIYNSPIIGNNIDYVGNEIRNLRLLSLGNKDDRFNWKYCVTIIQRAISVDQYEYMELAQRQSDEMGGLFTPQPSELPTNVHCTDGKSKALGYVGVTLNAVKKRLYIRSTEVGYKLGRIAKVLTDEEVQEMGPDDLTLYGKGFRILNYEPMAGQKTWIERWGVDATAWGASLEKPDWWQD